MSIQLDLEPLENHLPNKRWPILIAGPCSAESEQQLMDTALQLQSIGKVSVFRAGIWKPRTRPGMFEGVGETGLAWMQAVKKETGFPIATEVATPKHVELCLKHDFDVLWVGARTTPNPFSVQDIADALKGSNITVLVKNPINPDLQLWLGALERINKAGIRRLGVIHRGFSAFEETVFRNQPMWTLPIELRRILPNLPIIADPSHIAGNRELIPFVAQKALDLGMDGMMIESHINPDVALSDKQQQLTPSALGKIILDLVLRDPSSVNIEFQNKLEKLRAQIDQLDEEIIQKLSQRMKTAAQIGQYKKDNNVMILQVNRWDEILQKRIAMARAMGLSEEFMRKMLQLIHNESISIQTEIMNKA